MDSIKPPETSELKAIIEKYSPFLVEVRKRIFLTVGVLAISSIVGFVLSEKIIKILIQVMGLRGVNLVFTSPFQYISLSISTGLATGLIFSLPLLITQVLFFLKPALRDKEYKTVVRFLPFSIILFLVGFVFGMVAMKWQLEIFLNKSAAFGIGNVLDISKLLTTVLLTSIFMGISFQFPIVLLVLLRTGLVKAHQLARQRKWIYLGSFLFAILLPADSVIIDVILAMPLIMLFEFTMILGRIPKGKK